MTDFNKKLENLNNSLSKLNLSNNSSQLSDLNNLPTIFFNQNTNMALNFDHLDKLSKLIPIFSGRDVELPDFITTVENLLRICTTNDAANLSILISAIRSKIKGEARELLLGRADILTWTQIKELLTQNYSDNKSIETLELELQYSCLNPGEHLISFGQRIISLRARIVTKIQSLNITAAEKTGKISSISSQTFNIFKLNLPYNYEQLIRSRVDITTIEQAINFIDDEIKYDSYKRLTFQNRHFRAQKQTPTTSRQISQPTMTKQSYQQFQKPIQTYQPFPHFPNNPTFPSQPIRLLSPKQTTPNFPSNQQVFGSQENVFKPNPQQKNYFPKPQPMSGISSIPQRKNYFSKPQPMSGISTIPGPSINTSLSQNRFNQNQLPFKSYTPQPKLNQSGDVVEELFNNQLDATEMEPRFDPYTGEPLYPNELLECPEEPVQIHYPEEWCTPDQHIEDEQSNQNFQPTMTQTNQT